MSADSGPGNREVAYRLFAAEFEDSTVSHSESDEERAPNYVVTPTGGRVNRVFLVGVLTETERVGGEQLRGRVVDPTGAFVAYAGQYQPDELAFLDRVEPPAFLAITGKARTFSPEDSDRVYTSVRPESISEVDAATRDRWVVHTAEQTLDRVSTMASALRSDLHGEALRERLVEAGVDPGLASGITLAVEHYGTSSAYLQALRSTALDAVRVVAGERDEVDRVGLAPGEGGTEDAVLAGLAELDLGATGSEPGAAAGGSAATTSVDVGTAESREAAELAEATTTEAVTADAGTESESTESPTTEPEPETAESPSEPEPEPGTTTSVAESSADAVEADSGAVGGDVVEPSADDSEAEAATTESVESDGTDDTGTEPDDDLEDFEPGEFELPEEERRQVEEEFGTDFETAGEVDPAGEAGIETPDPDDASATAADASSSSAGTEPDSTSEPATGVGSEPEPTPEPEPEPDAETEPEPDAGTEPEPEATADAEAEPGADVDADVDVDEATVEAIAELDEGDGAEREAVVSTVAERHGVTPEEVTDAIEAAMMSGRAYEPSDGLLKAI